MAEALGVASGIIGIISLTIQVTQTVAQFGLDWKDAPKEIKGFMSEVQSLKTILSETRTNLLLNVEFKNAFEDRRSTLLSELGPDAPPTTETKLSIESCNKELRSLLDSLRRKDTAHRVGWERLKASFLARNLQRSIDKVHRQCRTLNDMVSLDSLNLGINTLGEVKQIREEHRAWHDAKQDQQILGWLSGLSFLEKQDDILNKRHADTGTWFLNHDTFKRWRNGYHDTSSILWCHGIRKYENTLVVGAKLTTLLAGAGKSVMTCVSSLHCVNMVESTRTNHIQIDCH